MDINFGFGRVIRVRWLKASRSRKHIFVRRDDSPIAIKNRWLEAHALLETRQVMRQNNMPASDIEMLERRVRELGYKFEDEESPDKRYSYWRFR